MAAVAVSSFVLLSIMPMAAMAAVPTITSLSPSFVTAGSGAFILTVNGSNFDANSVVRFNGVVRSTTYISGNQLNVVIPASDIALTATHIVWVENPLPGGGTSNWVAFTVSPLMVTPALPNTGFGPAPEMNLGMVLAVIALLAVLAIAYKAGHTWLVKQ